VTDAAALESSAPLPPRPLALRAGVPDPADAIASYRAVGRDSRTTILELRSDRHDRPRPRSGLGARRADGVSLAVVAARHWGRAFEIVAMRDGQAPREHGLVLLRRRPVTVTAAELERIDPHEGREIAALPHQVRLLGLESGSLRDERRARRRRRRSAGPPGGRPVRAATARAPDLTGRRREDKRRDIELFAPSYGRIA